MARISYQERKKQGQEKRVRKTNRSQYSSKQELAEEYGVSLITVRKWAYRYPDFPKPSSGSHGGRGVVALYDKVAVAEWLVARGSSGKKHATRVVSMKGGK